MKCPIGECLRGRPVPLLGCAAVALAAIACDFVLSLNKEPYATRLWPVLGAALLLVIGTRGDSRSLGIARPLQGYGYWLKLTLLALAVMTGVLGIALGIWLLLGNEIPIYAIRPSHFGRSLVYSCIAAPIVEELLYRFVLCVPMAVLIRPWGAVLVSGTVFGALHVVYGTPSPENLFGGFLLAWAYLHSGSLVVPLAWHAGGNFLVLLSQFLAFHFLEPTHVIG